VSTRPSKRSSSRRCGIDRSTMVTRAESHGHLWRRRRRRHRSRRHGRAVCRARRRAGCRVPAGPSKLRAHLHRQSTGDLAHGASSGSDRSGSCTVS
jgi:hypothetical protein